MGFFMRTGWLISIIVVSALGISGCSGVGEGLVGINDATSGTPAETANSGVGTGDPTGSSTGTSTGQGNSTGLTSFVYNDNAFNITGSARTEVVVSNPGAGINNETASVSVNTNLAGMTWADTIEMDLFRDTVDTSARTGTQLAIDGLSLAQNFAAAPAVNPNFTGYKEYRKIVGGSGATSTDAELQIWSYQNSSIGQYTVFNDPSAANNNNVSLFFDGAATPTSGLPTGAATYNGKFGGTADVSNFLNNTRTINDPFDTAGTAGTEYDPNGTWRVVGDTRVDADFGAGTVAGSITNTTWRKFTGSTTSTDGYITILPAEPGQPFDDYTFSGSITGNTFSGNAQGPAGVVVTGNNAVTGGFFGPNGEEVAGAISLETTAPAPSDGVSPNEEARRGFISLRGVFQGNR